MSDSKNWSQSSNERSQRNESATNNPQSANQKPGAKNQGSFADGNKPGAANNPNKNV